MSLKAKVPIPVLIHRTDLNWELVTGKESSNCDFAGEGLHVGFCIGSPISSMLARVPRVHQSPGLSVVNFSLQLSFATEP